MAIARSWTSVAISLDAYRRRSNFGHICLGLHRRVLSSSPHSGRPRTDTPCQPRSPRERGTRYAGHTRATRRTAPRRRQSETTSRHPRRPCTRRAPQHTPRPYAAVQQHLCPQYSTRRRPCTSVRQWGSAANLVHAPWPVICAIRLALGRKPARADALTVVAPCPDRPLGAEEADSTRRTAADESDITAAPAADDAKGARRARPAHALEAVHGGRPAGVTARRTLQQRGRHEGPLES